MANISRKEAEILSQHVKILIMTATDIEKETVFKFMKPLEGSSELKVATIGIQTYTLGVFAQFPVVHVKTEMGSEAPNASLLTTKDALDFWKPKAIVMIGIAFGKDPTKQRIGDVLISRELIPYESAKIRDDKVIPRAPIVPSGLTLFNRFNNCENWEYVLSNGEKAKKITGKVLSGQKLIDSRNFKKDLLELFPEAIGGEMEGAGIYSASFHENHNEWIIVKGICDWAEDKETLFKDKNQFIAAESAVSLCYSVMQNPFTFENLDIMPIDEINFNENMGSNVYSGVDEGAGEKPNQSSDSKNTTVFNAPIYGPIHTGSGNINNKVDVKNDR